MSKEIIELFEMSIEKTQNAHKRYSSIKSKNIYTISAYAGTGVDGIGIIDGESNSLIVSGNYKMFQVIIDNGDKRKISDFTDALRKLADMVEEHHTSIVDIKKSLTS